MSSRFPRLAAVLGLDTRSLAAFRVVIGLVVLGDLAVRATDLRAHYTDDGVLPRAYVLDRFWEPYFFSVHLLGGNTFYQALLFTVAALAAACLALGFRTHLAAIACWVLNVSLQNRNPMILSGADVLTRELLFWSMFLPLGARFSVDALRRGRSADERSPVRGGETRGRHRRSAGLVVSGATVGLTLQVMCVYVFAGLIKLDIHEWKTGTGIAYAVRAPEFARWLGLFVARNPNALGAMGATVPYQEILLPFLLLVPFYTGFFRSLAVVVFFAFHLGIALCMNIGLFVPISLAAWVPFIPPVAWERALYPLGRRVSAQWPRTEKIALDVRELLTRTISASVSSSSTRGILARGLEGSFARRTHTVVCLALASYVLVWNVWTFRPGVVAPPQRLAWVASAFRLDQRWDMFSRPIFSGGWLLIPGKLHSGATVNLFSGSTRVSEARPALVSAVYRNDRWRKYALNVEMKAHEEERRWFSRYLCISWNERHPGENSRLEALKIYWMHEPTVPLFPPYGPQKTLLWQGECIDGAFKKWGESL